MPLKKECTQVIQNSWIQVYSFYTPIQNVHSHTIIQAYFSKSHIKMSLTANHSMTIQYELKLSRLSVTMDYVI